MSAPLAYSLAPESLDEFVGQEAILAPGKPLRSLIEQDKLFSLILWGKPGCGKTSLSRLIAKRTRAEYIAINAVTAKIADIKAAIEAAQAHREQGKKTILFVDEIHRFSKTQQDALLPDVENGLVTMIGATTENPYFSVIPGLISRSQVFEFLPLSESDLAKILVRALTKLDCAIDDEARRFLIHHAQGDARKLLNLAEMASATEKNISLPVLEDLAQSKGLVYNDDDHYDIVSAFIKSMRGSDPDAAVYWLARLIAGGEEPEFIARRMIIFASEDIGNADPHALVLAVALLDAVKFVGLPEARINLSHVATYLACAPKSNAAYVAIEKAGSAIADGTILKVPSHLRDGGYWGKKKLGFGKGYLYPHNDAQGIVDQDYLGQELRFYEPKEIGFEKTIVQRLAYILQEKLKRRAKAK